jgi:hypothetical protein
MQRQKYIQHSARTRNEVAEADTRDRSTALKKVLQLSLQVLSTRSKEQIAKTEDLIAGMSSLTVEPHLTQVDDLGDSKPKKRSTSNITYSVVFSSAFRVSLSPHKRLMYANPIHRQISWFA